METILKMENLFDEKNGYVNLTLISKYTNSRLSNWKRNKKTILFIDELSKELNLPVNKLLVVYIGNSNKYSQGTFCHPIIATFFAQCISASFSLKISIWIEEWKNNKNNKEKYNNELINIKQDDNINYKEKEIQNRLMTELNGEIEVQTDDGFIDILTQNEIIEIKNGILWKHGLGQLLVYSEYYPSHKKRLHLFDIENCDRINNICLKHNIIVTYEQ